MNSRKWRRLLAVKEHARFMLCARFMHKNGKDWGINGCMRGRGGISFGGNGRVAAWRGFSLVKPPFDGLGAVPFDGLRAGSKGKRLAFSLVELLVVLAIIAILIA